ELLDPVEQQLFARLAVFAGGCTLEAAEEVAGGGLDTLQSLVDKSLVRSREGGRFWMLETIREYALERLEEAGELPEARRRHSDWCLRLALEAAPALASPEQATWLARLDLEHDNLRAAFALAEEEERFDLELQLAASL